MREKDRTARQRLSGERRRATLSDVARTCGVHPSTVSRALDPAARYLISAELVERIQQVSRTINYRSRHAEPTAPQRVIGVLIPDVTNPIFPPIIRGIEDRVAGKGYLVTIFNTDGSTEREREAVEILLDQGVAGLIVASSSLDDDSFERAIRDGTPVITVNRRPNEGDLPYVVNDDADGMRRILVHLLALGHRRMAAIAGSQDLSTGKIRHEVLHELQTEFSFELAPHNEVFSRSYSIAEGQSCMERLLAGPRDFTAVMCANDQLAVGAISALRRTGLRCPRDFSVTGFNDMPLADHLDPPLTTIRIQQYRGGQAAADMLLKQLDPAGQRKPPESARRVLPVELIVRGSTAAPLV